MVKQQKTQKKAEGMPLNIVVIAIMVLVTLAVVLFIFRDQITKSSGNIANIQNETGSQADTCFKNPSNPKCSSWLNGNEQKTQKS